MSEDAVLHRRSSGSARLLRGWIVAVLAVVLAAGGHQSAHSIMHGATEIIPLQLLVFATAITAPAAVLLSKNRATSWSTAATTIFGQAVFHGLYSLPYTGVSALPNGHHHRDHVVHVATSEPAVLQHAAHSTTMTADAVMLAAHLLAAALTVVVMTHGEYSLVTLVQWLTLAPVRLVLATRPVVAARGARLPTIVRVWIPHPVNVAQTRTTRGPPVLA